MFRGRPWSSVPVERNRLGTTRDGFELSASKRKFYRGPWQQLSELGISSTDEHRSNPENPGRAVRTADPVREKGETTML